VGDEVWREGWRGRLAHLAEGGDSYFGQGADAESCLEYIKALEAENAQLKERIHRMVADER
jgi:hypothetical protein